MLDSALKSRDITLPTKVHIIKAMVFPVVMYGCESWTIKKSGRQKTDAFEFWCSRVPWITSRSNQSILKEINPEYSLEGLMLKLQHFATWCEELAHWKRPWCWERLKAKEKWAAEDEMVRYHHQHEFEQTPGDSWGQGSLESYSPWGLKELATEQQQLFEVAEI